MEFEPGGAISFHFQKTPQYRTFHVDGAWGGMSPRGSFSLSFYSERLPIPKVSQRNVIPDADPNKVGLGPETVVDTLDGIVRQVECTAIMDVRSLQELYVFLGEQLAVMEETFGIAVEDRVSTVTLRRDALPTSPVASTSLAGGSGMPGGSNE